MKLPLLTLGLVLIACSCDGPFESHHLDETIKDINVQLDLANAYIATANAHNACTEEILHGPVTGNPTSGPACMAVCPVYEKMLAQFDATPVNLRQGKPRPALPERCRMKGDKR